MVVVAAGLNLLVYENHPHVPDEVAYLLQAHYFAHGMLWLPLPPSDALNVDLMYYDANRWFSIFPPGWPAALAVGVALGVPWLVNPVWGGVGILLSYRLILGLFDRPTARLASLLMALSPWYVFLAMSFMAHTFTLVCALAAALAMSRMVRKNALRWGLIAGVWIGVVSLIRPLDGLGLAVVLACGAFGLKGWWRRIQGVVVMGIGTIMTGALVLPYNYAMTGSATRFPIMQYFDKYYGVNSNALGFGPSRGVDWPGLDPFPGHGLRDVVLNFMLNTSSVQVELFGWAVGSLGFVLLFLSLRRLSGADRIMLVGTLVVIGLHSFYWFSGGPDFGARYWFLVIVPCVALTARGVLALQDYVSDGSGGGRVLLGAFLLVAAALTTFLPWRAVDKYHEYRGMRPYVRQLRASGVFGDGVVIVRGLRHPDYASAAIYNPLDFSDPSPVFVWDGGGKYGDLSGVFPTRPFWIVAGPTITGGGYEILAGPAGGGVLDSLNAAADSVSAERGWKREGEQ